MIENNNIDKPKNECIKWCEEHDKLIFRIYLIIMIVLSLLSL